MSEEKITLHCIVHGRVQGVCFRATAQHHAEALKVHGSAKNLPDGTVELYLYGDRSRLDKLLEYLRKDSGMASISHIDSFEVVPAKSYDSFTIIF